jgi:hypothetical protein
VCCVVCIFSHNKFTKQKKEESEEKTENETQTETNEINENERKPKLTMGRGMALPGMALPGMALPGMAGGRGMPYSLFYLFFYFNLFLISSLPSTLLSFPLSPLLLSPLFSFHLSSPFPSPHQ